MFFQNISRILFLFFCCQKKKKKKKNREKKNTHHSNNNNNNKNIEYNNKTPLTITRKTPLTTSRRSSTIKSNNHQNSSNYKSKSETRHNSNGKKYKELQDVTLFFNFNFTIESYLSINFTTCKPTNVNYLFFYLNYYWMMSYILAHVVCTIHILNFINILYVKHNFLPFILSNPIHQNSTQKSK